MKPMFRKIWNYLEVKKYLKRASWGPLYISFYHKHFTWVSEPEKLTWMIEISLRHEAPEVNTKMNDRNLGWDVRLHLWSKQIKEDTWDISTLCKHTTYEILMFVLQPRSESRERSPHTYPSKPWVGQLKIYAWRF